MGCESIPSSLLSLSSSLTTPLPSNTLCHIHIPHPSQILTTQSGAASWTTSKRQSFANDLVRPQLWAVTDDVNSAKSSSSPDAWKPPLASFYCKYARSWVAVKSYWELTVTSAEKAALASMLDTC